MGDGISPLILASNLPPRGGNHSHLNILVNPLSHIAKIIIAHLKIYFQSHYILFLRNKSQKLHIFVYFTKKAAH